MTQFPIWQPPEARPLLADDAVHFWRIRLDQTAWPFADLWALLSEDEQARATRFYFERDRRRFTVGKAAVRLILARYLDTTPARLLFNYGPNGKPGIQELEFNFSNSEELGLLGVSRSFDLGVDLEHLRPVADFERIAARFYSENELQILKGLPPEKQQPAFFNAWTRKEAYLKATGKGLSRSLREIEVSLVPGEPARFLSRLPELTNWSLKSLTPKAGFIGAVAVQSLAYHPAFFDWPQ